MSDVAPKIRVGRLFKFNNTNSDDQLICIVTKVDDNGFFNYDYMDKNGLWVKTAGWILHRNCDFITFYPDAKEMLQERLKRDR